MNLRPDWKKALESVFGEAESMTGCMHPDDRDERRDWLSEFLQELLTHVQATLPSAPMNWRVPGAPYRKIVAERHVLRLECGHQIIFAGRKVPKHRTKCPFCKTNSPNP